VVSGQSREYLHRNKTHRRAFQNSAGVLQRGRKQVFIGFVEDSRQGKGRMDVEIKFSYAINFDMIKNVALRSIDSFDRCLKDPPPRIGVQSDCLIITINAWTQAHGFQDTKLAFREKLMKDIKDAGIKLPGMG
jgi:small conductance mechanosensitive channel